MKINVWKDVNLFQVKLLLVKADNILMITILITVINRNNDKK